MVPTKNSDDARTQLAKTKLSAWNKRFAKDTLWARTFSSCVYTLSTWFVPLLPDSPFRFRLLLFPGEKICCRGIFGCPKLRSSEVPSPPHLHQLKKRLKDEGRVYASRLLSSGMYCLCPSERPNWSIKKGFQWCCVVKQGVRSIVRQSFHVHHLSSSFLWKYMWQNVSWRKRFPSKLCGRLLKLDSSN